MRKIRILAVGELKEGYWKDAFQEYEKRLKKFCDFSVVEIREDAREGVGVLRESQALLQSVGGYCVLLDIDGEPVSSRDLADLLDKSASSGRGNVDFLIGGSAGVSKQLKSRADRRVSFGRITFPHQLMRVVLGEQIYRAFSILNGLPYHK